VPASLLLGVRRVGRVAEAAVVLQAPSAGRWKIDHTEVDSPDVSLEPVPGGTRAATAFRVRVKISREGPQTSAVRFFIRRPGHDLEPVPMNVCYDGDARGILAGDEKGRGGP